MNFELEKLNNNSILNIYVIKTVKNRFFSLLQNSLQFYFNIIKRLHYY